MAVILCPTRGGESSVPNQLRAVALAKERRDDLIFLYISDVHFLDRMSGPVLVNISKELDEMGEFLLAMAVERASDHGIEAGSVVMHGDFRECLLKIIRERAVSTVIIGQSTRGTGITTEAYIADLAALLTSLGVEMLVADDGEVVAMYGPEK